jgi:glucokinase
MTQDTIIGVDLGGTRIRAARLDRQLNILERTETLTQSDQGSDAVVQRIIAEIRKVLPEDASTVTGIGVSSPGPLDPKTGTIINPPNLPHWGYIPLGDELRNAFGLPVFVGNDANVAALAEVARGAARGYRHVIYVTLSTGIGCGIVIDGRLLLGRQGFAAEIGSIFMTINDPPEGLEYLASGLGIAREAVERIRAGDESLIQEMVHGDLQAVTGKIVGMAAQSGDRLAREVVEWAGRVIGLGLVSILHLFDPEILVIGGGVTSLGDLILDPIWATIQKHVMTPEYWNGLVITGPELGQDVSIYGAAALVITQGGMEDIGEVVAQLGD